MSFFNPIQIFGMLTGKHYCPECNSLMEWEDENEDILVCPNCGHSVDSDHYGFKNDSEYDALYPTKEEVCGTDDDDEEDDYNGETYDEVYGELSDD